MTAHPIDTEEARFGAEAHLRYGGGGDDLAENVLALLDALAAAEHRATRAESRIKAVRDIHTGTVWPGVADKPICDACDQMWPCDTIRALDN